MKRRTRDSIQDSGESFYRRSLEIDFPIEVMSRDVRKIAEVIYFSGSHLSFPYLNRRRVDVEATEPVHLVEAPVRPNK